MSAEDDKLNSAIAYAKHCENALKSFQYIGEVLSELRTARNRILDAENRLKSLNETIKEQEATIASLQEDIARQKRIRDKEREKTEAFIREQEQIRARVVAETQAYSEEQTRIAREEHLKRVAEMENEIAEIQSKIDEINQHYQNRKRQLEEALKLVSDLTGL